MNTLTSTQQLILLTIVMFVLLFVVVRRLKSIQNLFRFKKRKRSSDKRKLTTAERQTLQEARNLLRNGKIIEGARLLESIEFTREAITILERGKLIHQAADILLRMRSFDRAGVVYRRNGLFREAAECFEKANLPFEAAKCYKLIGQYELARDFYSKAGAFEAAAGCCVELAKHRDAGRLYLKAGVLDKAIEQYNAMLDIEVNFQTTSLSVDEIEFIVGALTRGEGDVRLADIDVITSHMSNVVFSLIRNNSQERASYFLTQNVAIIGDQLLDNRDFSVEDTAILAELFSKAGAFSYAGIAFERVSMFDKAAYEFEKADDFERAAYCFERAMLKSEANKMRAKQVAASATDQKTSLRKRHSKQTVQSKNPFSMNDSTQFDLMDLSSYNGERQNKIDFLPEDQASSLQTNFLNQPSRSSQLQPLPGLSGFEIKDGDEIAHGDALVGERSIDRKITHQMCSQRIFTSLNSDQLSAISKLIKVRHLSKGDILIESGQLCAGLYHIISGTLQILNPKNDDIPEKKLLSKGELIGDNHILTNLVANFSLSAVGEVVVLELSASSLLALMDKDDALAKIVYKNLAEILLSQKASPSNPLKNILVS